MHGKQDDRQRLSRDLMAATTEQKPFKFVFPNGRKAVWTDVDFLVNPEYPRGADGECAVFDINAALRFADKMEDSHKKAGLETTVRIVVREGYIVVGGHLEQVKVHATIDEIIAAGYGNKELAEKRRR